jgi:type IV secretion system protein VirB10
MAKFTFDRLTAGMRKKQAEADVPTPPEGEDSRDPSGLSLSDSISAQNPQILSRKMLGLVGAGAAGVVLIIGMGVFSDSSGQKVAQEELDVVSASDNQGWGLSAEEEMRRRSLQQPPGQTGTAQTPADSGQPAQPPTNAYAPPPQPSAEEEFLRQLRQRQMTSWAAAMAATPVASQGAGRSGSGAADTDARVDAHLARREMIEQQRGMAGAQVAGAANSGFPADVGSGGADYNSVIERTPLAPTLELKAGGVIQAVLETGVNTDVPAMLRARVTEDVYDTQTGNRLLVPKGTTLLGYYNSDVAFGDKRVQIAWNRLIFPNGNSVRMDDYAGVDQAGRGGVPANVDNKRLPLFAGAGLMSLVQAAVAIVSDRNSDDEDDQETAGSIAINQMAAGWGNVTQDIVKQYMDVKPTLTVPVGSRVTVMVTRDLVLSDKQ